MSQAAEERCFHCQLEIPAGADFPVEIEGVSQPMCCVGCQAVASAIVNGGLTQFYQYRSESADRPDEDSQHSWTVYDLPEVQQDFVLQLDGSDRQAQLLLGGITCAACVWLIEQHVQRLPQVSKVRVNASTHRCWISYDESEGSLSEIFASLSDVGFRPQPATDENQNRLLDDENRKALRRLSIAGLGMMQVGMVAIALYGGELFGISDQWQGYLRFISFLFATPVVFYSAVPFYQAAWRAIKTRHLVMDVPVSIAIILAYSASVWATLSSGPDVYFDSVSMFTFLLLIGRYLEMRARHRAGFAAGNLAQLLPPTAHRCDSDKNVETVPLKLINAGDTVMVMSGETIPCDGHVLEGRSQVDESLLTGESMAVAKTVGQNVAAGTVNGESPLWIKVTALGNNTRLSSISRLVAQAEQEKPAQVAIADRVAAYFVAAVLIIAAAVFLFWWQYKPEDALWITLSVLVVTCPCALSLATPVALTAATNRLRRQGLLIVKGHVIETLTKLSRVVFDKTGTLTEGQPTVAKVICHQNDLSEEKVLSLAAALERGNSHPIAKAFRGFEQQLEIENIQSHTGAGVSGLWQGKELRLGRAAFVLVNNPIDTQAIVLAVDGELTAEIFLQDPLRESAEPAISHLGDKQVQIELLSGDATATVCHIAEKLNIGEASALVSPEQKLSKVRSYQEQGETVMMVGDGINDVPVLSGADVSVAMSGASDIAQTHADSLLLSGDLRALPNAIDSSFFARKIISQNMAWAIGYNVCALPLAAAGLVPPYAAAIGMSASSLIVVLNALRLNKL
ncbi:heavy metal translocating P-type ATPase [uncultured Pseudoteredinibacter sp.]|uniref:heavy metal translocating P-type ATPase n=1 Tax=uncultured Pseudoteredinibacter sp. TaxID=1641701 RepID=UPI0026249889|nr:heavy metal translocating P-type ATPase [uncultured Pseudoteredinibacter sp.]